MFVMEFAAMGSLHSALQEDNSKYRWMVEPGRPGLGRRLALQITDALSYLHMNKVNLWKRLFVGLCASHQVCWALQCHGMRRRCAALQKVLHHASALALQGG